MTIHITLLSLLAVVGSVAWLLLSFYLAAAIAVLVAIGGAEPEWWRYLKAGLAGLAVMAVMDGGPLVIAAWTGAWR